ncbi:MAG: hypothetical protein K2G23_00710, partial [Muribaculaceae bacterium]|nr:hypothetical protein [Muribaculaceae bacterium]
PTSTRGNPMGGEEGNGREHGIENEDLIHDINVFFYIEKNGQGMDSPDDTKIIRHIYYNLDRPLDEENTKDITINEDEDKNPPDYWDQRYVYLRFECTEDELNQVKASEGINFVAVANAGKLQYTEGKDLKWLREQVFNKIETPAWSTKWDAFSKDASQMDYFLMSTAYNADSRFGSNKISTATSVNANEYSGTTTLQRMYARLDLWYNSSADEDLNNVVKGADNKIKELKYKVKNATSNTVYLTNILPVNVMQSPSFLFKKVTDGLSSFKSTDFTSWTSPKYSWGGKESPKDGIFTAPNYDLPTNYVMERHTSEKKTVDEIINMSEADAAAYAEGTLDDWYGNTRASKIISKVEGDNYSIFNANNGKLNGYYDMSREAAGNDPTDYDCNHISIISYANENTHPTDCYHSNYLTGMAFRAVYVPATIYTGYSKPAEGENSTGLTELTGDLSDGAKIYRYSLTGPDRIESKSLYFTDEEVAEAYAKDNPQDMAIISEGYTAKKHTLADGTQKWGFICYYNLWLRHYNDESGDPTENYPMEYATVRNN